MRRTLSDLATLLATEGGGFTLWVGAGASIALTGGATPAWSGLVRDMVSAYGVPNFEFSGDFPSDLERLSQAVTHGTFRRELRKRLVEPIRASLSLDNAIQQSLIGLRASTIVSFNLEFFSAFPLTAMKCGAHFVARTFRERSVYALDSNPKAGPGVMSAPVYFPHGLLDQGSIVMTRSEYDRHQGSLAVTTAVHLAIGGDLVILGMSLGDQYLREAILQNRRWLRDVYWLDARFEHLEWARVANVTLVESPHDEVWKILSNAILSHDVSGKLGSWMVKLRGELPKLYDDLDEWSLACRNQIHAFATQLLASPLATSEHITVFASHCLDVGYDIPTSIAGDPRCLL